MNMYEHEALTMPTELERTQEAQRIAYETVEPFAERAEQIEAYVGVELVEPPEVRRDAQLPPGLVLMTMTGELQPPQSIESVADKFVVLTPDGQQKVRDAAAEIGIGRSTDLTLEEIGMPNDAQVNLEGGLMTGKFQAELELAITQGTGSVVATLSRYRDMKEPEATALRGNLTQKGNEAVASVATPGNAFQAFALRGEASYRQIESLHCLGITLPGFAASANREPLTGNGRAVNRILEYLAVDPANLKTEYDGGVVELMSHPDFVAFDVPICAGYVDAWGNRTSYQTGNAGSLVAIGTIQGREVYVQEVARQYLDENKQPVTDGSITKDYKQPTAGELLVATATLLGNESAAVCTSSTYFPSRLADVTDAKYELALDPSLPDRRLGVVAFCPTSLARAKGLAEPEQLSVPHLLGEVYMALMKFRSIKAKFQRDLAAAA